ncbi:MAG: amidohydrolase [Pyrinomonadaceae bacterium]|nr:amidohydrolase [Pyrinomonadaceae bacterium]MCX7638978.1 amidohydrolase [Pyrinomonadaceae bacterium]MDW8303803.1 amidohydrolase family protein [Acidobacteriota bacterium]
MKRETIWGDIQIFDAHVHFFSHKYFRMLAEQSQNLRKDGNAVERIGEITGLEMPPENPVDFAYRWIQELDQKGIEKAMMMASLPGDEDSVSEAVRAFPDRIYGGFFFNPLLTDAFERAKRAFDEFNLKVICFFPAMHGYSVADNETVHQIIRELVQKRNGRAVFIHCGALSIGIRKKLGLKSVFDLRLSNPLEVHKLASEYPDVNFIIPHFGAGLFREALMAAELCPNIYFDTSSSNRWVQYEPSNISIKEVFEKALEILGPKRLLFGTDSSFFPRGWNQEVFDTQVKTLAEIGISKEDAQNIFYGNLSRILSE